MKHLSNVTFFSLALEQKCLVEVVQPADDVIVGIPKGAEIVYLEKYF